MKKEITKEEYVTLAGLLHLAQVASKKGEECEDAAIQIFQIPQENYRDSSHFGDATWDGSSIDEVLRKMKITIKK